MPRRKTVRYDIDHLNRLWMQELDQKGLSLGPRILLEGSFQTENNSLLYRLRTLPRSEDEGEIPREILLTGRWSLTENHDLALTLDQATSQREGEALILRGHLFYADSDALGFAVATRRRDGQQTRTLRLEGRWGSDSQNRLNFYVEKEKGAEDALRFESAWETGKQNELIYRYTKRLLSSGQKVEQTLGFRGFWDISERGRLTYRLDAEGRSAFHFRATLETKSLLAKEGAIRYQIGIELAGRKKLLERTVTLFGKWKVNRDFSLDFELDRPDRPQRFRFGATHRFSKDNEIGFFLEDERGRPFGIELRFRKEELGAELFLRLSRTRKDNLIEAGGRIPF